MLRRAYGLALASNGSFNTNFVAPFANDAAGFATAVSNLTGVSSAAIAQFVNNWIVFYTANPAAHGVLSVTQAAFGAAFGDAVGVALLNPTVNGSIALLANEVQNALIDNAEGSYKPGIALIQEPPHIPLQGEALLIPNAGGGPFGPAIDWAFSGGPGAYAQFVAPAQIGPLKITNAPNNFTLNTQHFGTQDIQVNGHGQLFTLIVGDSTASESLSPVNVSGYSTVDVVVQGPGTDSIAIATGNNLVISGSGSLSLGGVEAVTITDYGVSLTITDLIGETHVAKIDASNAPILIMQEPAVAATGVTILGGTGPGNILQGSFSLFAGPGSTITFSNGSTGFSIAVGPDNFTAGSGGNDAIGGDGGPDIITLPKHSLSDHIVFGEVLLPGSTEVLAITDGNDVAYPGYWGASATTAPIPSLFPGSTGGTSTDMTVITGFRPGSILGDVLDFKVAAWNGASSGQFLAAPKGDLVTLASGSVVQPGAAQLSAIWLNSNGLLQGSDNVLRYAPAGAALPQNAQQLATLLHTSADAITLPGSILPGQDKHILVAYNTGPAANIADVDLVNTGPGNQSSTANLNVYASDMVSLLHVSLADLTSDNIHFI